ncbi:MAG: cytidylyltransferase domain-containing protein [Brevinema sp.]
MEKIFIGIQSRINSQRFPQKALVPILGIPLIIRVVQRLEQISSPHQIVLLCPQEEVQIFHHILTQYYCTIPIFGGSEHNVLSRYYHATLAYKKPPLIMRVTGDNPLVSPTLADLLINYHLNNSPDLSHYLNNPLGTGVEIFTFSALERCFLQADTPFQQEHVTQYIYQNPHLFSIAEPLSPFIAPEYPQLSIDYPEDLALITRLLTQDPLWDISFIVK